MKTVHLKMTTKMSNLRILSVLAQVSNQLGIVDAQFENESIPSDRPITGGRLSDSCSCPRCLLGFTADCIHED